MTGGSISYPDHLERQVDYMPGTVLATHIFSQKKNRSENDDGSEITWQNQRLFQEKMMSPNKRRRPKRKESTKFSRI